MADLPENTESISARALLRERDYLLFWGHRWMGGLAGQIQSVAMGWHMYTLARIDHSINESAFIVSMLGLAGFAPVLLLTLPAGQAADRYDRRRILQLCLLGQMASVAILGGMTASGRASTGLLLGVAALFGACRAFFAPAGTALAPMLVPRRLLPRAIAWNSLAFQTAAIAGPAAGGFLSAHSPQTAYLATLALYIAAFLALSAIRRSTQPEPGPGSGWTLVKEGLAYVWRQKIVFGAISLDLVAVLLGGATALLPIFARDVLHGTAREFGILRAAPAIGATLVGLWLAAHPIRRHAGGFLFGGVALFGVATIVFGLSKVLWLSVAALVILGGADMFSVYLRHTLVQLATPDAMRGRVAAVSSVFIGASNELGEFESGLVARFLGPVGAVVFGGAGALAATALWTRLFPDLRRADRLE